MEDFNYFLNKAINQYVNKRYNLFDINQQSTDDLGILISTATIDIRLESDTLTSDLPLDYLHLLNCTCIYKYEGSNGCIKKGSIVKYPARRLTSDMVSEISIDYYNRPKPTRPYYFIHENKLDIVNGENDSSYILEKVKITYLRTPDKVELFEEDIDNESENPDMDTLNFPDYVCNEIVNELVNLVMSNIADPRLETHIPVTQSIASPIQQGQQKSK